MSSTPAWEPAERWTLDSLPRLEIGAVDGDAEYLFDRIRGVVVLDDGGVAVANEGTATIRFYDAQGEFRFERGGKGGGPEEFFHILGLYRLGDRLVAQQWGPNPTRLYTLDGTLVESFPSAPPNMFALFIIGLFSDRTALLSRFPQGGDGTGMSVENAELFVASPQATDTTRPMLSLPAVRYVPVGPTRTPQDLGPLLSVFIHDDQIYYGWPEEYDIQVLDRSGQLLRRIRRVWEPVPISREHVDTYERMKLEVDAESGGPPPDELVARRRQILDQMVYPEHFNAFDAIRVDKVGNVWVRTIEEPDFARYVPTSSWPIPSAPAAWDVFDTAGVWLGSVELPARFDIFELGDDYVAGVWRNELGVEFVRVYSLRKPGLS